MRQEWADEWEGGGSEAHQKQIGQRTQALENLKAKIRRQCP